MANTKITELTQLTNPVSTDVLPIVDVGADVTKKISIADLLKNASVGTAAAPGIAFDGDNAGIYSPGADQVAVATNGAGRLFVDGSGNVGVGSGDPQQRLHVQDTTIKGTIKLGRDYYGLVQQDGNALNIVSNGDQEYRAGLGTNNGSGRIVFKTSTGLISNTECFRITADGKLGVGVSSPSANIHIGSTSGKLRIGIDSSSQYLDIYRDDATGEIRYDSAQAGAYRGHVFLLGGSEVSRIDASGRFGVGSNNPTQAGLVVHTYGSDSSTRAWLAIKNSTTAAASYFRIGRYGSGADSLVQIANNYSRDGGTFAADDVTQGVSDIKLKADGGLGFSTAAAGASSPEERLVILPTGAVGVGVASPSYKLHVNTSSNDNVILSTAGSGYAAYLAANGGGRSGLTGALALISYNDGSATISNKSNAGLRFETNSQERFRVTDSGKVLIGTSSAYGITGYATPDFNLSKPNADVTMALTCWKADNIAFNPSIQFQRSYNNTENAHTAVPVGSYLGVFRFAGSDGSVFRRGVEIRAEADGGWADSNCPGRLIIATTASGGVSTTSKVGIYSNGVVSTFSSGATALTAGSASAAGTTDALIIGVNSRTGLEAGGSISFRVWSNGNVVNTNNSYGAISDIKLKENIVDATSQWDDLKALQVRNYNFKEGQIHTQIGLIAQEVELVSPGLVSESPDRDEEGNDLGTVTKSVNYSVLYMKAVKALQEAMERIETLEAKVAALEGV